MPFIVKKKISGKEYYYLNENKRVEGKVKTKTLAYLGKDRKKAEEKMEEILNPNKEKIESQNSNKIITGKKIDEINKIASTRGFFFQTASIYGGKAGFYTYGHLGKLLKNNWENLWRNYFLSLNENFYEIQSNNILPQEVFKASGHIDNFNDPLVECTKCHLRFRADEFLEDNGVENAALLNVEDMNKIISEKNLKCPKCSGELSEAKQFNMMFSVNVGFDNEQAYLSPETAQGAYITFLEEFKATRERLPLGLAIIDKAYRNEISPRQMFFRLREFSQAELQIFFNPEKVDEHENWNEVKKNKLRILRTNSSENDKLEEISCENLNKDSIPKFYLYHASKVQDFYLNILKIPKEKFRFRQLHDDEKAFYNKIHFDVEIDLETFGGFKEIGGIHYRGDHDLTGHKKISNKKLEIFHDGKRFIPHVLELSFGVDRNVWSLMDIFYGVGKEGSMFKFPSVVSPVKAAIFPLVKKPEFEEISMKIFGDLKKDFNVSHDSSGSIGRRYARNDEIGTPYCITVDGESLTNKDVTIRNRNNAKQIRVKIEDLKNIIKNSVNEGKILEELEK